MGRYFREKSEDERRQAKYEPLVLTLHNGWAMKDLSKNNAKTGTDGEVCLGNRDGRQEVLSKLGKDCKRPRRGQRWSESSNTLQ